MEKLYMQDSQQEQSRKQKKGLKASVDFSVALTVIVAAFALFSVASFGLMSKQKEAVSYAAPTDEFTMVLRDTDDDDWAGVSATRAGSSEFFYVPFYYANTASDANRIFCIQKSVSADNAIRYTRESVLNDAGLVYILEHSYPSSVKVVGGGAPDFVEIWATQAAIWLYASKHYDQAHNAIPATGNDSLSALKNADTFALTGGAQYTGTPDDVEPVQISGVYSKIESLVTAAEGASSSTPSYTVTVDSKDAVSKSSDGKYFRTEAITVTGHPTNVKRFDITGVTGIDGVKVVDASGNEMSLTNIPAGTKFFLSIPANKVTEKVQKVNVSVKGYFPKTQIALYAAEDDHQKVISLEQGEHEATSGRPFEIVGSPDTGMNAAQTIYFIGLIVLLCGVGIVYANTKPVASKQ